MKMLNFRGWNEKIIHPVESTRNCPSVIWKEPGFCTSYSEMMGLPNEALSDEYWFPWYNFAVPASMDQGLRIAVP